MTAPGLADSRLPVTGERVTTSADGFNPTWQRHVAAYALCAPLLPDGRCIDLGCGIGHSSHLLAPRATVGVDIEERVLRGQERETRVADMRRLPFPDASFASAIAVHSIEHVSDPERVLAEARRVVAPGGVAAFVTPNRLTFGPPGEIVDPYHRVEFSPPELLEATRGAFERVELRGLFGSRRYLEIVESERARLDRLLRRDPLRARRLIPRGIRKRAYDRMLRRHRGGGNPRAAEITTDDFDLQAEPLEEALDLVAICS